MSEIKVEKLPQEQLKEKVFFSCTIWEKEAARFDWQYDTAETCYILKGKVTVEAKGGKAVNFGPGDFVTFPNGLDCVWDIKEPVRKHYSFE